MEHAVEIKRLKACINDLIGVLALPAIWSGTEPSQILSTLLDVLLGMLRLDFAYARLSDSFAGGSTIEMVRSPQNRDLIAPPPEIGHALNAWLKVDPLTTPLLVRNPIGQGDVAIVLLRLGLQDEVGVLVAGSNRADFPTETERLLLGVAANQAAIGLQEARLLSDQRRVAEHVEQQVVERTVQLTLVNDKLRKEILERKRAEDALRKSESYLAGAQKLSQTGSFGWSVQSGEIHWSEETYRIFGYDRVTKPTVELVVQRTHHEDAAQVKQTIERASHDGKDFAHEYRLAMPDGSIKHLHVVAHAGRDDQGNIEFVGSVMDVTERKRAEEALRKAQEDLAHVSRMTTMGELVASIAHEVNQPLGAIVTNGQACVHLLSRETPDLEKLRQVVGRMINDGLRASDVIKRIRDLLNKTPSEKATLDINETVQEVIALVSSDVLRSRVELRAELEADLPPVVGDRIQLQQVILNLILNAKDAMMAKQTNPRELQITSRRSSKGEVVVVVRDSGKGLDAIDTERIFDPFFTTKPEGMGLGLSISQRIIEDHGGRMWATANDDKGATIQFTLPASSGSES